ncbi:MAG: DUF4406 domain-containing protein [Candidatus Pacebacteria bacterium]|jgi:hypothetical protein|nr:DUF4406 domain-containing protein [Candidatus Paceibacterota bacterium]
MIFPKLNEATKQYWTESDFQKLEEATTIQEVFAVAKSVILRMPDSLAQVCGPITNGGKGSVEKNLEELDKAIDKLQKQGVLIFDQMPFEEPFRKIAYRKTSTQHHDDVLNLFYEPIFKLGKIKTFYFLPGWEGSKGAIWEYHKAEELGIKIVLL